MKSKLLGLFLMLGLLTAPSAVFSMEEEMDNDISFEYPEDAEYTEEEESMPEEEEIEFSEESEEEPMDDELFE
jgi:hypothetical protein